MNLKEPLIKQSNMANSPALTETKLMSLLQEVQTDLTVFDEILRSDSKEVSELIHPIKNKAG